MTPPPKKKKNRESSAGASAAQIVNAPTQYVFSNRLGTSIKYGVIPSIININPKQESIILLVTGGFVSDLQAGTGK